uniref:Inhibitor of growth protein n=1 Tax=Ciona savignyi TaxID=51511 RepID=H2YFZ2_CIOSA
MEDLDFSDVSDEVLELATNYAENYVDYVENLPFDSQRNVTRLREIDCSCREILTEIESMSSEFTMEGENGGGKRGTLLQIQRALGRFQELGDEKISIVQQINESIENRKKQVDHSSYRFKIAFRPEQRDEFRREAHKVDHQRSKRPRRRQYPDKQEKSKYTMMDSGFSKSSQSGGNHGNSANPPPEVRREKKDERKPEKVEKKDPISMATTVALPVSMTTSVKSVATKSSTKVATSVKTPTPNPNGGASKLSKGKKKKKKMRPQMDRRSLSPQIDLPIDPDEPTFCICDQVSFGQMIACDNKKCPLEWYHFSCVGLTAKPKGKWYCPDCLRDMRTKRKKEK